MCMCTCVWVCKTDFFCPTNEMNEIIWNGMAVGGCPFPGIHLENLNPSPSIILRAQRKSVTCLHRRTQLIHLIFLRSRGIMVMTESELGLPNPKHRLPTQRPCCLCPDKLEQDLGSPVQTVSLAVDVWKERKLLLFWETFQARQRPAHYRPTGWIPMLPPPLKSVGQLGMGAPFPHCTTENSSSYSEGSCED